MWRCRLRSNFLCDLRAGLDAASWLRDEHAALAAGCTAAGVQH